MRPHGVRGALLVAVASDVAERFAPGAELLVRAANGAQSTARVVSAQPHAQGLLVRFAGCDDRTQASAWGGASLEIPRAAVPAAPPGSYWQFELIGCRCVDARLGELGTVVDMVEEGGGWSLVVRGDAGVTHVPFVEPFLRRVDPSAGTIELDLPEGLVAACTSPS